MTTFFHGLWASAERLSDAITVANWGIAASLLSGFLFTAFVIIAGNRKDEPNARSKAQDVPIAEAQRGGAAEATATAKQFESKIAESDARVKEAQRASVEASDKAEGFRADIARANESARQAEARAAEANLELARFKAPRSISAQQQASASGQIRPFAPIRIDVLIVGQTMEINNIANSVLALIRTGGWTIGNFGSPMGGLAATGISVATHMNASAVEERAANGLVAALRSVGLDAGRTAQYGDGLPAALTGTWDMSNTAHVRIVIGAKP